jgi:hypothetical protein
MDKAELQADCVATAFAFNPADDDPICGLQKADYFR